MGLFRGNGSGGLKMKNRKNSPDLQALSCSFRRINLKTRVL